MAEQSEEVIGMVVKLAAESTDFQNQMNTLNRQMKVLQSDYKAASSTSKDFEESMDGLAAKSNYLNNAIKTQQSIIDAHSARLEKSKQKLSDLAASQMQLKSKLDSAKSSYEEAVRLHGEESYEVQKLANELKELQSEYDKNNDKVNKLSKTIDNQTIAYNNSISKLNIFKNDLKETTSNMEQMSNASENVNEGINNLGGTGNPFSSFTGGIKEALGQTSLFGVSLGDIGGALLGTVNPASLMTGAVAGITSALTDMVLQGIQKAVEALGQFIVSIVNTGNEFYAQVSRLQALTQSSSSAADGFKDLARTLGSDTVYSASQAAQAMEYAALAGWKLEDMTNGMPAILNLAAASGEELSTVSDILTDALTALGYTTEYATQMADVFSVTMSNSNTNVEMLGEAMSYAGATAGALGYSMEDVSLAIGLMANQGVKASMAGTSLRKIMVQLAGGVELSSEAMGEFVINSANSDGTMKPLKQTIDELRKAFSTMTEEEKAANAEAIGGKTAMTGLLTIVNAAEEDYQKLADAISNSAGASKDMAETMTNNVSGQMTLIQSKIESIGLSMYAMFEPFILAFTKSCNFVISIVDTIVGYISTSVSTITGFITPIADVVLSVVTTIYDIVISFIDPIFNAFTQPFSRSLDTLRSLSDTIVPIIKSIGAVITPVITGIANTIAAVINLMCGNFEEAWKNVKNIFGKGSKDVEKQAVTHADAMAKIAKDGENETTSTIQKGTLDKYQKLKEVYQEIENETDKHYDKLKLMAQSYTENLSANEEAYAEWKNQKLKEWEEKYDETHDTSTLNQIKRKQQAMAKQEALLDRQIENDRVREENRYANLLSSQKEYIDTSIKAYEKSESEKEKIMENGVKKQMSLLEKLSSAISKALTGDIAGVSIQGGNAALKLTGYETGTNYVPYSGSYLVGERGPEIVDLPRGAGVRNNREVAGSIKTDMTETNNLLKTLCSEFSQMKQAYKEQPSKMLRLQREGGY